MSSDLSPRIQRLSASVVNKIAAGEVIERPASVVKELLENAVDALSTRIQVDVEQGGLELIRIVDDGEGIHPDDVELAVTSHATSKLRSADDLFQVSTMGFRGEALASIAEVSQFRLRTKQRDQPVGVEMAIDGGELRSQGKCGCPDGTQMEVRQLFFNTPVRRKFMKTPATEFAHLVEQFTRIAIAHPMLHLTLKHGGRLIHDLPPTQHLLERIELFFGSSLAQQLIAVEAEHNGARVWGFVGHPSQTKSTRKGQYLFLNGRWIQDRSLQHALSEAYRGLIMVGRYPMTFLFLEISPELVDVNVHPTKSEVRFQDSQSLYRLLLSALRNKFLSMDLDSQLTIGRPTAGNAPRMTSPQGETVQQELMSWVKSEMAKPSPSDDGLLFTPTESAPFASGDRFSDSHASTATTHDSESPFAEGESTAAEALPVAPAIAAHQIIHQATNDSQRPASAAGSVRAMQVHDCYLVVETPEGITVIDQHALHERIMYEHLRKRVLSGSVEVQKLLMPITVEVSAKDAMLLLDQAEVLEELGLHLQDFGGNTLALTAYPVMLKKADPETLLRDVVDLIETSGRKIERRDLIDKLLHMMSCKAAIKSGHRLSLEEMEALLVQRHLCDDAHHCPHGRPTALQLTRTELDRQFGRLGS